MFDTKLLVLLVFLGSSGVCFAGRRNIHSTDDLRQSRDEHLTWIDKSSLLQNRGTQPSKGSRREPMNLPFTPHTMDVQPQLYSNLGYKKHGNDISEYMGEIPEFYYDQGYKQPKVKGIHEALNKKPSYYNDLDQHGNVAAGSSHRDIMQSYPDHQSYKQSGDDPSTTRLVDTPPFNDNQGYQPTKYDSSRDTYEILPFLDDLGYKANRHRPSYVSMEDEERNMSPLYNDLAYKANGYDNFKQIEPPSASMEDEERKIWPYDDDLGYDSNGYRNFKELELEDDERKEKVVGPAGKRNKESKDRRKIRSVDLGNFWFWAFVVLCITTCCGLGGTGVYVIIVGLCDFCYSILCTILFLFLFICIFTILNTSVIIMEK